MSQLWHSQFALDALAVPGRLHVAAVAGTSSMITLNPPLLLFRSAHRCWKCGTMQKVIALGSVSLTDEGCDSDQPREINECALLSFIEAMPPHVAAYLRENFPQYGPNYSQTADMSYYANVCECGAPFGDHFLFGEPGGTFFPETDADASQISCMQLPFQGKFGFEASYSVGPGEMILRNARAEAAP
jgi:hypothetical protein